MIEKFLSAWCRQMHNSLMWPMHGKYKCSKCLREHPVAWETRRPVVVMPARGARTVAQTVAPASMDVCA